MAEDAILGHLNAHDLIPDSHQFAASVGIPHIDIENVIKSLHGFQIVVAEDVKREKWILTDEGKAYARDGSPEAQLHAAVPPDGIPRPDLQRKLGDALFKIGSSQAVKNKWVEIGKQLVTRKVENVEDRVKYLLNRIEQGEAIGVGDVNDLKKRKLILLQAWKGYSLTKGSKYTVKRVKAATDLTREHLQRGDWKDLEFKEYNLTARAQPIETGCFHPLLKMATPPVSFSDSSFYVPPGSTDPAWQYGYLASRTDPNTVTCRLCKKIVKGGVYRFKQHLAHRKGNVAACPKVDEETKNKMIAYLDDVARKKSQKAAGVHEMREEVDITGDVGSTKRLRVSESLEQPVAVEGSSRQMTIKDAFSKDHRDRVSSFISKWAYTSAISFNAMTTKNFLQMVEAIGKYGPGLKPPTRYELSGPLLKKAVKEIHDGLQGHRDTWTSSGCSLMTDAWTDKRGRSIINFCVNCTLGTSFLKSIDASNEAHTAEYICKLVEECLNEVGVDKVVQIVADNASANAAAGRLLVTKYPQIWWTPCAAHSIDLALEEISRETKVRSAITKAKRLTVFIYSHTKTLSLMRKFTNKRDIARPGQTRFATTFLTLESLNEKKDKLRLMFSSEEWRNCKWYKTKKGEAASSIVFSPTFWNHTTHAIRVFTPLVRLLRVVDADRRPSMGFVYGGLEEAKREIIAVFNGVESSYKFFVDAIISKTKGRLDTPLHLAAYYLNPFYFYTESHGDPDVVVMRGFKECMEKFYPDLDIQDAITRDELPTYRLGRGDFGKPLAVRQRMINDGNFDPANWWHNHGDDTPHLKALAIKILSLTSSSSGCERNWSTFDSVRQQIKSIFLELGFVEMPTNKFVESSFWNFDALFQPQQHPARDSHDTFFLKAPSTTRQLPEDYVEKVKRVHEAGGYGSKGYRYNWKREEAEKNLLRTHTTAVSSRMLYLLAQKPFTPMRYFSIDRVFRNEAVDRTHLAEFHQIEGVVCDRGLTLGDLIGVLSDFFERLGMTKLRFKPAYNPYTEPSMEIFSYHDGLKKWVEVGNSGMFRPEMLQPMGLPEDVSVIAWGLSLERPTMILYGIDNIRDLFGPKVSFNLIRNNPICRLGFN